MMNFCRTPIPLSVKQESKAEYDNLIEQLLNVNQGHPLSLLNLSFSRTIYGSELFSYLLFSNYILGTLPNNSPKYIYCPNPCFGKFLQQRIKGKGLAIKVKSANFLIYHLVFYANLFSKALKTFVHIMLQRFLAKKISERIPSSSVLIDTFLTPNCIATGSYRNRYYLGLEDFVNPNKFTWACCISGFSNIKSYFSLRNSIKELRKHKVFFIESLPSLLEIFRLFLPLKTSIPKIKIKGVDFSYVIKHDALKSKYDLSTIKSQLLFLGIKKLAHSRLELTRIINWDENQIVDQAWNLGFKTFYPNLKRHSYRGFVVEEDLHFHLTPSKAQVDHNLNGDEYLIIGKPMMEHFRTKNSKLNSRPAPAFRFQYLNHLQIPTGVKRSIIVCLPIGIDESRKMIKDLSIIESQLHELEMIYRPHPTHKFTHIIPSLLSEKKTSSESVSFDLCRAHSIISNTSSICYEAFSKGIKVIIYQTLPGFDLNPIPENLKSDNILVSSDLKDIFNFLMRENTAKEMDSTEYFYQPSKDYLINFFGDTN